MLAYFLLLFVI